MLTEDKLYEIILRLNTLLVNPQDTLHNRLWVQNHQHEEPQNPESQIKLIKLMKPQNMSGQLMSGPSLNVNIS
jgi:hypothetical protein